MCCCQRCGRGSSLHTEPLRNAGKRSPITRRWCIRWPTGFRPRIGKSAGYMVGALGIAPMTGRAADAPACDRRCSNARGDCPAQRSPWTSSGWGPASSGRRMFYLERDFVLARFAPVLVVFLEAGRGGTGWRSRGGVPPCSAQNVLPATAFLRHDPFPSFQYWHCMFGGWSSNFPSPLVRNLGISERAFISSKFIDPAG
jgi:hypothetical protein